MTRHYEPSLTPVRGPGGLVIGGTAHRMLLALRAGQMERSAMEVRMGIQIGNALNELRKKGYIREIGRSGLEITPAGREVVSPAGPMARSKTLNTYCQL